MRSFIRVAALVTVLSWAAYPGLLQAQVSVTTYHNDNARTGQNTQETTLSPTNVNSSQFGKLFTTVVDGYVYAQPLYLSNVSIQGGTHNVLYVATEHNSVYAIDADSGAIDWQINLTPAGGTTVSSTAVLKCGDLSPEAGISGTPVIDTATGTLYVVAAAVVGGNVVQYLHAIDVRTATEKFGGPILIQGSAPGTATDGNGTTVSFNALYENQRAALLLEGGHVVIAWASHCDVDPWHGWVMSYNAATLAQEAVFNPSADGRANGVWMTGGGAAADANGNIFFATGNGTWNGTTDFGDSIVKLGPPAQGSFPVLDYFTPYNQSALSAADMDVSAGGLVLLPALASGRQLLAQMGKEGKIVLLDQLNLGKNCAVQSPACTFSDPQIVQEIPKASVGIWGSPAYWNGNVYWGAASGDTNTPDTLKAFSFNAGGSGLISTTPTSVSAKKFGYPAPTPTISSDGASGGILWGLDNSAYQHTCNAGTNCQVLYAYDAGNLANMLYNSAQAAGNRDVPGSAVKFSIPTVANGKVYVPSEYAVSGYGLLGSFVPPAPNPSFAPPSGSFTSTQSVALSDTLSTAAIHYTTDGTTPGAGSALYSGPLQLTKTTTINAIAVAAGYTNSGVATATYTLVSTSPGTPLPVNLSASYNVYAAFPNGTPVTNGGMDTGDYAYSANLLGSSISWNGSTFNLGAAGVPSAVAGAVVSLPAGNFTTIKLLGTAVQGEHVNQTFVVNYTDGSADTFLQSMSDWLTPQNYPGETKVLTMPYRVRVQGTLNGTVYLYGYSFTINSAKTVASLVLPKNRDIVILAVDLNGTGSTPPPPTTAPAPAFTPPAGSFTSTQSVSLSDNLSTAAIHYTIDGSTPGPSSPLYSGPLQLTQTTTINAIAVATGYANSSVATAKYTLVAATGGGPVNVNLSASFNVYAIFSNGTPVTNGGMDTGDYAYSENLLGSSLTWAGATFNLGGAGVPSAVDSTVLTLPAGNFSALEFLGAAVQGNHIKQTFVVTYTDGSSDTFVQSMSDWLSPQGYPGETKVLTMTYRLRVPGILNNPTYLYGYSFALNKAKTVQSITPPANRDIVILSMDLMP
jgi:Chitobiase/beta-hexosaminidase C-terminal domain